jgi:hypothetical protein
MYLPFIFKGGAVFADPLQQNRFYLPTVDLLQKKSAGVMFSVT